MDDNDYDVDDEYMPDINAILQWFRIDTSQFRTVPLKMYEKEMLLTKVSTDVTESPTISQRIGSLTRKARYTKKNLNTHHLRDEQN